MPPPVEAVPFCWMLKEKDLHVESALVGLVRRFAGDGRGGIFKIKESIDGHRCGLVASLWGERVRLECDRRGTGKW